ncbi:MAG TPA: NAD(P) transhydrogenase subunit beta, partial [Deltaproteobacteria bacterium]|nr:NAD(P) transhydrogenase subunit beta [Deltaproteobacteria bacterium]
YIMCEAMNRSIWSVVLGGFGTSTQASSTPAPSAGQPGEVQPVDVDQLAGVLKEAKEVVVVPGYGMAV